MLVVLGEGGCRLFGRTALGECEGEGGEVPSEQADRTELTLERGGLLEAPGR